MEVRKRKSIFTGLGCDGDFGWMICRQEFERTLFVFNDNERQFNAFHEGHPSGLAAGGGNAIIRPFQGGKPQRAAGIPTGEHGGYEDLTTEVMKTIDRAVQYIEDLLRTGHYEEIVFSYDSEQDTLGTGIFNPHPSVKRYIYDSLMQLG